MVQHLGALTLAAMAPLQTGIGLFVTRRRRVKVFLVLHGALAALDEPFDDVEQFMKLIGA